MSKKKVPLMAFAMALVCFTLPFVEVSCQGQKIASFSGLESAFGTTMTEPGWDGPSKKTVRGNGAALLALIAVACAAFFASRNNRNPGTLCGAAAVVLLFAFKAMTDAHTLKEGQGALQASYQIGFWGALLMSALGAAAPFVVAEVEGDTKAPGPHALQPGNSLEATSENREH